MDTINEINAFESAQSKSKDMDIHGNLYEISQESDTIVNGEELSMDIDYGAYDKPEGCPVNIKRQTLHNGDEHFPINTCGTEINVASIQVIHDLTTKRRDLVSVTPAVDDDEENKKKHLSKPIDINGIPVMMNPEEAKIYLNMVPTIKDEKIIDYKSCPTIKVPFGSLYSCRNQENGSIEKILYDIIKDKGLSDIVLEKNRVIHGYYTHSRGNVIDIYEIQPDLLNPGKFTKIQRLSQEIPDNYQDIAVINDKIFLYKNNPRPNVKVYQILQDNIQPIFHVENDVYSMQDFLNLTNLKTFKAISRNDYAKMEQEYIKNMLKQQNINNGGLTINLENRKGGIKK